ncbi:MAG TPA: peptidoglycan DD-metalloendopeptidase family protein [Syntrophales bacterium]|nr:peptidoglycan DD-metalloendopeptidase family protein [Syntrophales bacterium]HOX95089.1 peptidoglycan DD-metalloendopeptidase family protein [Syntrophales bacterium]HPI57202.1 peptidoglycan DD-metalloendopeptidase family protein [Syntrophales bacterium]HPN23414.1 peptidoglycan DD-metalloendopeptidase family protein [Syntrophales bacterium]HQM28061.1 peptidoglycan DD-metalloendopeptidase family protein [Syntrophales bacterium]
MSFRIKIFISVVLLLIFSSCTAVPPFLRDSDQARGVYHHVKSGETLWRISQAYGIPLQEIAEVNNITDPAMVTAGSVLFIPDAHRVITLTPVEKKPRKASAVPPPSRGTGDAVAKEYAPPREKVREEKVQEKTAPKADGSAKMSAKGAVVGKTAVPPGSGAPKTAPASKSPVESSKPTAETAAKSPPSKPEVKAKPPAKTAGGAVATAKPYEPAPAEKGPTLEDVKKRIREEEKKEREKAEAERKPAPAEEPKPVARAEPEKPWKPAPAEEKKQVARATPEGASKKAPVEQTPGKIDLPRGRFMWPVKGKVTSKFGIQSTGMKNNGIRITAKEGSPVVASAGGTVIYSAPLKYYGDTVLLRHDDNYVTVYTNLKDRVVKKDDRVKKGEKLALLAKPGDGSENAYLYFEIRQHNKARNPMFFLP